jgi:RhoGEF domain/Vacuolar protein sorting-associated protein 62
MSTLTAGELFSRVLECTSTVVTESKTLLVDVRQQRDWFLKKETNWGFMYSEEHLSATAQSLVAFLCAKTGVSADDADEYMLISMSSQSSSSKEDIVELVVAALRLSESVAEFCFEFSRQMLHLRDEHRERERDNATAVQDSASVRRKAEVGAERRLHTLFELVQRAVEHCIQVAERMPLMGGSAAASSSSDAHVSLASGWASKAVPLSAAATAGASTSTASLLIGSPNLRGSQERQMDDAQRAKLRKRRAHVLNELLSTERSYVRSLRLYLENYVEPLRESLSEPEPVLAEQDVDALANGMRMIHAIHSTLCELLTELLGADGVDVAAAAAADAGADEVRVGRLFLRAMPLLRLYSQFINGYDALMARFGAWMQRPRFAQFVGECFERVSTRDGDASPLRMDAYLIQPIQRLPRLEMLLKEMLKATLSTHADYETLRDAASQLGELNVANNSAKRKRENMASLRAVQAQIAKMPTLLNSRSTLLRRGVMQARYHRNLSSSEMHLIMFSDVLVLASAAGMFSGTDQPLVYEASLRFTDIELKNLVSPSDALELIKLSTRRKWRFWAGRNESKDEWLRALHQAVQANCALRAVSSIAAGPAASLGSLWCGVPDDPLTPRRRLICIADVAPAPTLWHKVWDDRGTGMKRNLSIWLPTPPRGFYTLGGYVERHHDPLPSDAAGAVMLVRDDPRNADTHPVSGEPLPPLLAKPVGYKRVWLDSGSGGDYGDVAIWRPVAPDGYVALGDLTSIHWEVEPDADRLAYRCVHRSLLTPASIMPADDDMPAVWSYSKPLNLKTPDTSLWSIASALDARTFPDAKAPGTFVSSKHRSKPPSPSLLYAFRSFESMD